MIKTDKLIHEPTRMKIMSLLSANEKADFNFLKNTLNLTDGNLSTHLRKLEKANYVHIEKTFVDNKHKTYLMITSFGKKRLKDYIRFLEKLIKEI